MEDVIPERNKMQPFSSFRELLKTGNLVSRRPTTSLPGEENQPRLIHKTSTLVTKMKRNSSQRDQPHSQGFSPLRRRRPAGKDPGIG